MKQLEYLTQYDLSDHNTMALSCVAEQAIFVQTEEQIQTITTDLQSKNKPYLILSGGSNVLLPAKLNATVLIPTMRGIEITNETEQSVIIEAKAGENWHQLVIDTVNKGWYGLENLALIPGLVGAAPVQNIGAYGKQLEDVLTHVTAYHIPSKTWQILTKEYCQFGYRDSIFKRQPNTWFISRIGLSLHKDPQRIHANYGDVQQLATQLANQDQRTTITPKDIMAAIIQIRQHKLPDPTVLANCGSFFQNPIISEAHYQQLQQKFSDIVAYPLANQQVKIAAGWLIDKAGLKGKGIYPILTHDKQALVLTNHQPKQASQQDIQNTQDHIISHIEEMFAIRLVREPVWVNADGSSTNKKSSKDY